MRMRREANELDGIAAPLAPTPGMENLPIRSSDVLPSKRTGKPIVSIPTAPRKRGRRT